MTLTVKDGKVVFQVTYKVAKDAAITCDGKACKLEDLKADTMVTATTTKDGDTTVITKIEAVTATKDKDK